MEELRELAVKYLQQNFPGSEYRLGFHLPPQNNYSEIIDLFKIFNVVYELPTTTLFSKLLFSVIAYKTITVFYLKKKKILQYIFHNILS